MDVCFWVPATVKADAITIMIEDMYLYLHRQSIESSVF
jgi:hypothetical protein